MLIAIGALRDQSPDEGFVHRAVPFRRPDHLLHNPPLPVDPPALGHARRLVRPLDGAGLIVQDVEREPQLTGERRDDRVAALIDAHRQDLEVLPPAEPLMQALHGGHLDAARLAPRRPHIEEDDLAAVVGQRDAAAGRQARGPELGGPRSHGDEIDLRSDLDDERGAEHERRHDPDADRPLTRVAHTVTKQRRLSSRTSRPGSGLANTALPATNVSAPAACAAAIVCGVMPPSTSRNAREPCALRSSRARRILSFDAGKYVCPPKPGFTVMSSSRSRSASTSAASASGEAGLSARPASIPRSRAAASCRCTCPVASGGNVDTDAPAAANGARERSRSTTKRRTSSGPS